MANNPTTREENTEKIERKEKNQQLAHKLAGDIYFLTTLESPPENFGQRRPKIRTLENGAESSSLRQKARVLETHLVKINKPNGQMKAAP